MRSNIRILLFVLLSFAVTSCNEEYKTYSDKEYVMFSTDYDVYPVEQHVEYFKVPVVSTVKCAYDRTFGVEVIDKGSNAIEGRHYRLRSNTLTIKAGETRTDVEVHGEYDRLQAADSLGFKLRLVLPEELNMPVDNAHIETAVVLRKCCPFTLDGFVGDCVVTSQFLYNYAQDGVYQRLISTERDESKPNTIIMHDWLYDGYDVTLTFVEGEPLNPLLVMDKDQVVSDEGSVFGIAYGDDHILVDESLNYPSYYYTCDGYVYLWVRIYVEDIGNTIGTVGEFLHIMEWVSPEEADRLRREEGM